MRSLIKKILLQEGRVDTMKKRYPEHGDTVDFFVENDPSNNNKYLQWMMKQVVKNGEDKEVVLSATVNFHNNVQRLEKKDINQYKRLSDLQEKLQELGKSKGEIEREIKREGANVLFENDNVLVIRPLTHQASCKYGAGTKWCVTMKNTDKWWKNYTKKTARFGGTDWYNVVGVEEKIVKSFWDRVLGRPGKTITKEIKEFAKDFPVGILYFIIYKRRVSGYTWNDKIKARIPTYEPIDPKDKLSKLAILYRPGRSDFGDMRWSEYYREGDFLGMIGDRLDASHNNMSIFNAQDYKVTLSELTKHLGEEFSVPFRFVEHDFQKERDKLLEVLSNVYDKVTPLMGAEGSNKPMTWIRGRDGKLVYVPTSSLRKYKEGGKKGLSWQGGRTYKGQAW